MAAPARASPTTPRLRIGVACHPAYGGSGVVASELGKGLAARGHDVHFFSHSLPFRIAGGNERMSFHEVEVTSYPVFRYPPYTLALAAKLFEVHQSQPLDVIHSHYAIPHAVAAYLCREMAAGRRQPRTVTTLHGTDISLVGLDSSFFEITRFSLEKSDAITAVSDYLAAETRARFRPSKDVRVIPNFVDPEAFSPALRSLELRRSFASDEEMLVGHLSNFRPVKRVLDVVRAFHFLSRRLPARLVMIGAGVDLEPARNLAAELGLRDRVTFLGALTQVANVLAQLDVFFLTSEFESFGLAALEAMASGVPVISTRAGGIPEVVEDGASGLLYAVGAVEDMARGAYEILSSESRRRAMADSARRRAVERFPPQRALDAYESLYVEALAGGVAAGRS